MFETARVAHIGTDPRIFPGEFSYTLHEAPSSAPACHFRFPDLRAAKDYWSARVRDLLFLPVQYEAMERDKLVGRVVGHMLEKQPVVISGLFRIGKSSFCRALAYADPHCDCLRVSVGNTSLSGSELNRSILMGFSQLFPEAEAERIYRQGFKISKSCEGREDLMAFISKVQNRRNKHLLLILDECSEPLHRLSISQDIDAQSQKLAELHRGSRIRLALAKHPLRYEQDLMARLMPGAPQYTLGPLSRISHDNLVDALLRGFGSSVSAEGRNSLFEFSGGRMLETRLLLALALWRRHAERDTPGSIQDYEIDQACADVVAQPTRSYFRDFRRLRLDTAQERKLNIEEDFWQPGGGAEHYDFKRLAEHYEQSHDVNLTPQETAVLSKSVQALPQDGQIPQRLKLLGLFDANTALIRGSFARAVFCELLERKAAV